MLRWLLLDAICIMTLLWVAIAVNLKPTIFGIHRMCTIVRYLNAYDSVNYYIILTGCPIKSTLANSIEERFNKPNYNFIIW